MIAMWDTKVFLLIHNNQIIPSYIIIGLIITIGVLIAYYKILTRLIELTDKNAILKRYYKLINNKKRLPPIDSINIQKANDMTHIIVEFEETGHHIPIRLFVSLEQLKQYCIINGINQIIITPEKKQLDKQYDEKDIILKIMMKLYAENKQINKILRVSCL